MSSKKSSHYVSWTQTSARDSSRKLKVCGSEETIANFSNQNHQLLLSDRKEKTVSCIFLASSENYEEVVCNLQRLCQKKIREICRSWQWCKFCQRCPHGNFLLGSFDVTRDARLEEVAVVLSEVFCMSTKWKSPLPSWKVEPLEKKTTKGWTALLLRRYRHHPDKNWMLTQNMVLRNWWNTWNYRKWLVE